MKKIKIETACKKMLSDIYTPVGIYLRLRDKYRETVLMESVNHNSAENGRSIIGINAIGGIEVTSLNTIEFKYPNHKTEIRQIKDVQDVPEILWNYMKQFEVVPVKDENALTSQSLIGYTSYNAVQFFDTIRLHKSQTDERAIPLMRYRLYQYVIVINHFKSEMYLCENKIGGLESDFENVEKIIVGKNVPFFPFSLKGQETSNKTAEEYKKIVQKGIKSCLRGDVFQIVLSRRFQQKFLGDDFNVYRALRSINPSPYLFYFDYSDYKLMGSSPESQIVVRNKEAVIHPIAGTYKRTGNLKEDKILSEKLLNDPKEIAEHTMLVDLARNDLSKNCTNVHLSYFKEVHRYSHVLHIVSEVVGDTPDDVNPFKMLANSFPAGTLSGAPKYKAMQLIDEYEKDSREAYGGTIGSIGFNGDINHAIIIRSFMSKTNTLFYQAGAGIVAKSVPENELMEVDNKLGALKQAITLAAKIKE